VAGLSRVRHWSLYIFSPSSGPRPGAERFFFASVNGVGPVSNRTCRTLESPALDFGESTHPRRLVPLVYIRANCLLFA
jgi:hypothetical protein